MKIDMDAKFADLLRHNPKGVELMHYLIGVYYDRDPFVPKDPYQTMYHIGQQSVVRDLLRRCEIPKPK